MMMTPCRTRSFNDHRQYYENVKPKVITRWENGTPKMRNGKFVCNKLKRRMTDTFLVQGPRTPPTGRQSIQFNHQIVSEEDDDDNVFEIDGEEEIQVHDASIAAMASSSRKMDTVKKQFTHIFTKLEDRMKNKTTTEIERAFILRQIKYLHAGVSHVDFLMSELTDRGDRLEKFLDNRDKGLDWNYWNN